MAKPATPTAKPAVSKPKKPEHVEVDTDHQRAGAVGDYVHESEGDVIAAAAKDHEPGEGPNVGEVDRPGRGNEAEDA